MPSFTALIASVIIAICAAVVLTQLAPTATFDLNTAVAIVAASLGSSFATAKLGTAAATQAQQSQQATATHSDEDTEFGAVKWFNVSKGFGFITLDSGEEVFVHFRSILGEGRRSLRDGQRVRLRVVDTDKGPQAEDVEPVDA